MKFSSVSTVLGIFSEFAFLFALLSAIFAALTSILAKIGIEGVHSNLATAIRTVVVVIMSWGMVFSISFIKFSIIVISSIMLRLDIFSTNRLFYKTIIKVPKPINTQPIIDFTVTCSWRMINANTSVITTGEWFS